MTICRSAFISMNLPSGPVKRAVVVAMLVSAAVGALALFGSWFSVAPHGSDFFYRYVSIYFPAYFLILVLYNALYLIVDIFGLLSGRRKTTCLQVGTTAAFCGILFVFMFVIVGLGEDVRHAGFRRIALRGAPLVKAIKRYQAAHGAPPTTLDDLVPECLPSIPDTGAAAYPSFYFLTNTNQDRYGGNQWVISVDVSSDDLSEHTVAYYPNGKYPGGPLDLKLGDWSFVSTPVKSGGH